MSEIITLNGIMELVIKKVNEGVLKKDSIELVKSYLETKKGMISKGESNYYKNRDFDIRIVRQVEWYLKNILEVEDASKYRLPKRIHPAGCIQPGFVIEPLGHGAYLYNWLGIKGKAVSFILEGIPIPQIEIKGNNISIDGKNLKEIVFRLPSDETVNKWVNNTLEERNLMQIWDELIKYFKTFGDLSDDIYYLTLALFVIQSWVSEMMDSVFYVNITGSFGAGKSTLARMVIELCKHGLSGDPSPAVIARLLHNQKITLFIDELDSINPNSEDSALLSIIRKGYRKGDTYIRCNENNDPIVYNVFGPKIFTVHGTLEDALMNRSLPIMTSESETSQISLINSVRTKFSSFIFDKIFYWYMNNIIYIDIIDIIDYNNNRGIYMHTNSRSLLYDLVSMHSEKRQLSQLEQFKGRNAELGFVVAKICKLISQFGGKNDNPEVNRDEKEGQNELIFKNLIKDIFENKMEIEEGQRDIGLMGVMRDFMVREHGRKKENEDFITREGFVKLSQKEFIDNFQRYCKDRNFYPSTSQIKGLISEFGFVSKVNLTKLKVRLPDESEGSVRLCLVYDFKVLRKLGLKAERIETKLNKILEEDVKDG